MQRRNVSLAEIDGVSPAVQADFRWGFPIWEALFAIPRNVSIVDGDVHVLQKTDFWVKFGNSPDKCRMRNRNTPTHHPPTNGRKRYTIAGKQPTQFVSSGIAFPPVRLEMI